MNEKTIRIGGFGTVRLVLKKRRIVVASIPEDKLRKFKELYPDGVVGDALDFVDLKRLGKVLKDLVKSLQ